MKKLISVFCVILVLVCMIPVISAFSADSDFVIEDGVLLSYTGEDKSVTIPSSVRVVSYRAFADNKTIESVKFGSELYSIGDEAFYGCTSLEKHHTFRGLGVYKRLRFLRLQFHEGSFYS